MNVTTAEEYMSIPKDNPNRAKVGLTLPYNEFQKLSLEEKSIIFAEALVARPIEEQLCAAIISKNVLNGCCWEFVRSTPDITRNLDAFKKSQTCNVLKVTYNRQTGTHGYLVYMNMQELCKMYDVANHGPIDSADLQRAATHREEAKMGLIKKLQKGYNGRIGIFCTNNSQSITVDGKTYPAFAVTLRELCGVANTLGYKFPMGGSNRSPEEVIQREEKVIENLTVAPSSNALFVDIVKA